MIREGRIDPSQEGAHLSGMVLDVAEVVDVQLAARELAPGDGAGRLERLGGLRRQRLDQFLAADLDVFEGFLLAQAEAGDGLALRRSTLSEVVGLLFAAATINYIDRQMIGVLKPTLSAEFGWSESDFAYIVFWFQVAYAAGLLLTGRVLDRIGVRAHQPHRPV